MTISRGDTGVDHSQTSVDNSSRVNKTKDDHSINTSTVADNSSSSVSTDDDHSDHSRRTRISLKSDGIKVSGNHVSGGMLAGVIGMVLFATIALRLIERSPAADRPGVVAMPPISPPPDGMIWVPPNQAAPGQSSITTRFAIGRAETTTAQFAAFVSANAQWRRDRLAPSAHDGDYLKDWTGAMPSPDLAEKPVAYVTWGAADAFCRAQGNRLPTEQEWDYAARVGPIGLGNMAGSLWEWTSTEAPLGPSPRYVVRGGGWQDPPGSAGVEARQFLAPTTTAPDLGFRCVR